MSEGPVRLERYLGELRARLRGLPAAEASEIVEEIASHVRESVGGAELEANEVGAVLDRLGSPAELAALYATESLLARAGRSRSPWLLLRSLGRFAKLSVGGFFAFLGLLVGYGLSGSFALAALMKPFAPGRVGLWHGNGDEFSLHLGFVALPQGEELLGWWLIPLGLAIGAVGLYLTTRFGRWAIRRFRRGTARPDGLPRRAASWPRS